MIEQFKLPVDVDDNVRISDACEGLNSALQQLIPLARKMYLLSFNGACSAARAGSGGDAFRVLTQDIQYLGDDVTVYIKETQLMMENIMTLASSLVPFLSCSSLLDQNVTDGDKSTFTHFIYQKNNQLMPLLHQINLIFFELSTVVKKGEYLAVFASVEAANSDEHYLSFEAVASKLKTIIADLKSQTKIQKTLLYELAELVGQ